MADQFPAWLSTLLEQPKIQRAATAAALNNRVILDLIRRASRGDKSSAAVACAAAQIRIERGWPLHSITAKWFDGGGWSQMPRGRPPNALIEARHHQALLLVADYNAQGFSVSRGVSALPTAFEKVAEQHPELELSASSIADIWAERLHAVCKQSDPREKPKRNKTTRRQRQTNPI